MKTSPFSKGAVKTMSNSRDSFNALKMIVESSESLSGARARQNLSRIWEDIKEAYAGTNRDISVISFRSLQAYELEETV